MGSEKKVTVHTIVGTVAYLLVLLGVVSFMITTITLIPTPIGIITSGSMRPTIDAGDVVFLRPAAVEELRVGDIVGFHALPVDKAIIHRVTKVLDLPGKTYVITKGDANLVTDQSVGLPPVSSKNFIGKVFCLDGQPLRIPRIGSFLIRVRNFSIWLTQNKIWSFWAPMLAMLYVFVPYLSPRGLGQFDLRESLRVKIPVTKLVTYSLIAFIGISAFTLYFRTETYTLSMRVACLEEFEEPHYIVFGSMIYGETKDNTIEVSGPPLFPVKMFVMIEGTASELVTSIPHSARIEPNSLNELTLQASIPAEGEVSPGLYSGRVYIFSDTLLLLLPDTLIFSTLSLIPEPLVAAGLLDGLASILLASLLGVVGLLINGASSQVLYTMVWRDKLEARAPHAIRVKMRALKSKIRGFCCRIVSEVADRCSILKKEVRMKRALRIVCVSVIPATALFLLVDNVIIPILALGLALGVLIGRTGKERRESLFSAALANLLVSLVLIARWGTVFLYSAVNPLWCMVSASFVGSISYVVTLPFAMGVTILVIWGFRWTKVWYLEQHTSSWNFLKPGETPVKKIIRIPAFKEFEENVRRKYTVSEDRGICRNVLVAMSKARKSLRQIQEKVGCFSESIKIEACVAFLTLRKVERKFIGREVPLLRRIKSFAGKLRFMKKGIKGLMENTRWVLHFLAFKISCRIKWRVGR